MKYLTLILIMSASTSNLFAQDTTLQDLNQNLDIKKSEVEHSLRPIMDEKIQLEDQQKQLHKRIVEIDNEKSKALSKIEQPLPPEHLRELMSKVVQLGSCKIKAVPESSDFVIEQGQKRIRFVIAPADSAKVPLARLVGEGNDAYIEILQDGYVPANPSSQTAFKLVLRFEPGTQRIRHAIFTGERLDDGLFGWTSSRQATILTCVLE